MRIIISDMGWLSYTAGGGGSTFYDRWINHPDREARPDFFNNGWTDGHVSSYRVRDRDLWPLVWNTSARGTAVGMDMMAREEW
jgi:hypothetical protein